MEWKKYQARASGQCAVDLRGEGVLADFEMGIIETGRSRAFFGYYIKITSEEGGEWIGEDRWSAHAALRALDEEVALDDGRLLCAGLRDDFHETGLSANTGFGYIEGFRHALHMMDRAPFLPEGAALAPHDNAAKEILAAMRKRAAQ